MGSGILKNAGTIIGFAYLLGGFSELAADNLGAPEAVRSKPSSCERLLKNVGRQFFPLSFDLRDFGRNDFEAIRQHAKSAILQEMEKLEASVLDLHLARDELLSKQTAQGRLSRSDLRELAQLEIALKQLREPKRLEQYRRRMQRLNRLYREIELADIDKIALAVMEQPVHAANVPTTASLPPSAFDPNPSSEVTISRSLGQARGFSPRRVFRHSLLGVGLLGLVSFVAVPGAFEGARHLARYGEREDISWITGSLGPSSEIPTFEEVIRWSYANLYAPAADWSWETYGHEVTESIVNAINQDSPSD